MSIAFTLDMWSAWRFASNRFFPFVKPLANRYFHKERQSEALGAPVEMVGSDTEVGCGMTHTPQQIANYFLERAEFEKRALTQLKLIKLVYIAYGWYLALTGQKLFNERIEAWKHGPVIPSLYHEFKAYGSSTIDRRSYDVDLDTLQFHTPTVDESDEVARLILDRVWSVYKDFSGWTLREKTHESDTPWAHVYKDGVRGIQLNDEDIREHYSQKIRSYLEAAREVRSRTTS